MKESLILIQKWCTGMEDVKEREVDSDVGEWSKTGVQEERRRRV